MSTLSSSCYPHWRGLLIFWLVSSGSMPVLAQLTTAEIVEKIGPATVSLECPLADGSGSSGSGFIVSAEGVVITNHHVVAGCTEVTIKLENGDSFKAVGVMALDEEKDLAILRIPGFQLPTVELGDSDEIRRGDDVVVLGNALGMLEGSVTKGVVSSIREAKGMRLIQMDAAVSSGNSGGPVTDDDGRVIAVTVAKIREGESLNFAVPINYARGLLAYDQKLPLSVLASSPRPEATGDKDQAGPQEASRTVPSLSGTWVSPASSATMTLSQNGRFVTGAVYGTSIFQIQLTAQGDRYSGSAKGHFTCTYDGMWDARPPVTKNCQTSDAVNLEWLTDDRVKIRVQSLQPAEETGRMNKKWVKWCKACGQNRPKKWNETIWIRQ